MSDETVFGEEKVPLFLRDMPWVESEGTDTLIGRRRGLVWDADMVAVTVSSTIKTTLCDRDDMSHAEARRAGPVQVKWKESRLEAALPNREESRGLRQTGWAEMESRRPRDTLT